MMSEFRPPKGTRDLFYEEANLRRKVIERLRGHFLQFGFGDFDTPAIEHLETLGAKSGPDVADQVYAFEDKGGRRLGLVFEFTASLGRVVASYPEIQLPFKRYQIGKVWRYESPQSHRYREFYQADIDIIGPYSMDCEAEILLAIAQVLRDFGVDDFRFILNNRKILRGQLEVAGLTDAGAQGTMLRGLDKLDKIGLDEVREYVLANGVTEEAYERFMGLLPGEGSSPEVLDHTGERLEGSEVGREGVEELRSLLELAGGVGLAERIEIAPFLVRGLEYYTGPVFEVRSPALGNTSFGGGGRYDDLVEVFGGRSAGAVGFAFGVDRLVSIVSQRGLMAAAKCEAGLMIAPRTPALAPQAFALAAELRAAGIPVYQYVGGAKVGKQFAFAERMGFPMVLVVGEDEVASGRLRVKLMEERQEAEVARAELAAWLAARLPED